MYIKKNKYKQRIIESHDWLILCKTTPYGNYASTLRSLCLRYLNITEVRLILCLSDFLAFTFPLFLLSNVFIAFQAAREALEG